MDILVQDNKGNDMSEFLCNICLSHMTYGHSLIRCRHKRLRVGENPHGLGIRVFVYIGYKTNITYVMKVQIK